MSISASITLKSRPDTGQVKTGDWLDIKDTGITFGPAPDIKLFDPVRLVDGQQIRTGSPLRGTYVDVSANAKAVLDGGECWLPSRDPTQESSTSANTVNLNFETTPFAQFFWFHRMKGRTGRKFPWATAPDQPPVWTSVIMKPWWFTTSNNGNEVDQVLPNFNASGASCFGNSSLLSKTGAIVDYNSYPRESDFYVTNPTCFGYYQSGDESSFNALDALVNIQRYDNAGFSEKTFNCDPFRDRDPISILPIVQDSSTYTVAINGTDIPNAYVSGVGATLSQIRNGIVAYVNSNQSTIYAILSPNGSNIELHNINTANTVRIACSTNIAVYSLTPTVQNNATYTVNINGTPIPNAYVSGSSATLSQILTGIASYINANTSSITASVNAANTKVDIFTPNRSLSLSVTASKNITAAGLNCIVGASAYFRLQWMSQTNTPTGGWQNVQMLTNWMYLATGEYSRGAIFIGDANTLAGCKDPKPFAYDLWNTSAKRIVIDKLGFNGFVHYVHYDGTVYNNIMGGVVA